MQRTANFRVISHSIARPTPEGGDVVLIKAQGVFDVGTGYNYPASLHFETFPGDGVVPCVGDDLVVTIAPRVVRLSDSQTVSVSAQTT